MADQKFGTTGGNAAGGMTAADMRNIPETMYPAWQFANDIYGFSGPEATAEVFMERGVTNYQNRPTTGGYQYGSSIQKTGGTQDTVVSLRDAMNWAQQLDAGQMSNFTSALYAGGLYPATSYKKGGKPPSGKVFDDAAKYGAVQLYKTVVEYNLAHPQDQKSMTEILKGRIDSKVGQDMLDQNVSQQPGNVFRVTTDDPATLRVTVTKTAQAILGRAVTDQEQAALVEKMLKAERAPQESAITAGQTTDTGSDVRLATAQVDAQAQLEEQLKAQHPDEADAYSELNYYNVLSKMLGGGNA